MAKSITVIRKPGRPATGVDPAISIRLPIQLIRKIEDLAAKQKTGRSQVIRKLLLQALSGRGRSR
jgi:Ribbon-helix-helix protein, copG family